MIGERFGSLVVTGIANRRDVSVRCDCGRETRSTPSALLNGTRLSCTACRHFVAREKQARKESQRLDPDADLIVERVLTIVRRTTLERIAAGALRVASECEVCATVEDLQVHHEDYAHPDFVIVLCRSCHRRRHERLMLRGRSPKHRFAVQTVLARRAA